VKHYDINEWTDYVRQVGDAGKRHEMAQHLDTGCKRCQGVVTFLKRLVSVTKTDEIAVPDHLVRNAKALFALRQPEKATLVNIVAKLVFDTFREPLPAGVRGQQRITRQAMYEAGDYCVDLRMEHERGGALVTLIGQVASRTDSAKGVAGAPVMLMAGTDVVAKANCNRFGEFQMEYQPQEQIRLHVPVAEGGRWIEVRLHELAPENSGEQQGSEPGFGESGEKDKH
jgi:hypothetical protein